MCSKNSDQLSIVNRLTDIFAVGKFDYGDMVRYQNLTRKPELFRASWARVRCTSWTPLTQALLNGKPVPDYNVTFIKRLEESLS